MTAGIDEQITSEDLGAKQLYDEYREIKLLLEYVRKLKALLGRHKIVGR